MTEEQRWEIVRLARQWSDKSFARGLNNGNDPEFADNDRRAADAFYDYMDGLR